MSVWNVTKQQSRLVQPPRAARNGMLVSSNYYASIARAQNHIVAYRRKWLGGMCQRNNAFATVDEGQVTKWRMYFRTGHGVKEIYVRLLLAPSDNAGSSAPAAIVSLYNPVTLLAISSFTRNIGIVDSSITDVPDNYIDTSGTLTVSDDTAYGLDFVTDDGARFVSATVWEIADIPVDDTVDGAVDPRYSAHDPILDYKPLAMAQGQTELLMSNRHHLISWSSYGDSAITNDTDTYTNIIDGSSTAVSVATPGWYVQNQYCNTLSRTGVPCVFAVYAEGATNGGYAQLTDGTNTLTTAAITTAGWYTATGTIPAAAATKYDVHAKTLGGGSDDITVHAVALLEYE
jgi:hypothetical protein